MNPWKHFEQPSCLPDGCQCEAVRDAFIRQPSSTWSSLAYVFAGLFIYRQVNEKSMDLKVWTLVCVTMGMSSLVGHMSFIKLTLALDFASIVLVISFFGLWNLLNLLKISSARIFIYFSIYYVFLFGVMYGLNKWAKVGLCILVFGFAMGDVVREMGWRFLKARTLQWSIATLALSFGIYIMDEMHIDCRPLHLFQWHSVWHMGTALSMFLYGKWRFEARESLQ
jgi:hypothetical protein